MSLPFEPKSQVVRMALPDPWSILGVSAPYKNGTVLVRQVGDGSSGASIFWVGPSAKPRKVVVFFTAAGFSDFSPYQTWIDHLAQRGFVVFVPKLLTAIPSERSLIPPDLHGGVIAGWRAYANTCGSPTALEIQALSAPFGASAPPGQEASASLSPAQQMKGNASASTLAPMLSAPQRPLYAGQGSDGAALDSDAPLAPPRADESQPARWRASSVQPPPCPNINNVAIFGHGEGAILAANWSVDATANGLPQPQALLLMSPESHWRNLKPAEQFLPISDWTKMPSSTFLLLTTASNPGDLNSARALWAETQMIPPARRNWVVYHSDAHGTPALVADALSPTSLPREDNLNYYGYWKLGDALLDDAWKNGVNHDAAFGGGQRQRFMGVWSDGRAVTQPDVVVPNGNLGLAGSSSSILSQ